VASEVDLSSLGLFWNRQSGSKSSISIFFVIVFIEMQSS